MQHKYCVLIQWSKEDKCFMTMVPELPGCMSEGKTKEEAIANTDIAVDEWINTAKKNDIPIPQPKRLKKEREDEHPLLDELFKNWDGTNYTAEEIDWGKPVGKEIW